MNIKLDNGFHSFTFISNSDGLRETKDYDELGKSIIFLGDSIIEGAPVDNHEVLDEIFENHTGITSLNFGVASSTTVLEYFWLKAKYKNSYNTKLVVLGFCLNDFESNNLVRYFDASLGNWPVDKRLNQDYGKARRSNSTIDNVWKKTKSTIKKSRLVTFVYCSISNLLNAGAHSFTYKRVDGESRYYADIYLNKINKFAEEIGSEFVVVIFPQKAQLLHDYEPGQRMQDALIEILEKNKIKYIDLYDLMREKLINEPEIRWYHDEIHPLKEGHRVIGEYLAQELPAMFPEVFINTIPMTGTG
jgi:hypothetical protein